MSDEPRAPRFFASGKFLRRMAQELRHASFEIRARSQMLRHQSARLRTSLQEVREQAAARREPRSRDPGR